MKYETKPGETIGVLGSTKEFGCWDKYDMSKAVHMKWNEGNIWTTKHPIMVSASYFQYKYIVIENNQL